MEQRDYLMEKVLDDMLSCSPCSDVGKFNRREYKSDYQKISYLLEVIPAIEYVKQQLLFYLFSNGLTTGSINQDELLNAFLYRKNSQGVTNYSVIKDAIGEAVVWGQCGLRMYEDNLYLVKPYTYAVITGIDNGIEKVVGYAVTNDGKLLDTSINLKEAAKSDIREYFRRKKLILLDTSEFLNIRNNTSYINGRSPLLYDKLRVNLLVGAYDRLNNDLNYEGPGRIVLHTKQGYITSETNDISTKEILNESMTANNSRLDRAKEEAKEIAKGIKESTSDNVIVLSDNFSNEVTHLPKVTKATEFLEWLKSSEGLIVAELLGMSPSLLELGDVSGNVSMEKIIDNSMLNTIVPMRESFSIQFSDFISSYIGVTKVYFDKYEMQQSRDVNDVRKQIVDIMDKLHGMEQFGLENDFAIMLGENIRDENGKLIELKIGVKEAEDEVYLPRKRKEKKR